MSEARSPVVFGDYLITRRIARGGMAEIYRALCRTRPRWAALKLMRRELGHEELRSRLFEREARITRLLSHPNVVPVYDFGRERKRAYLAMEYVHGKDLSAILNLSDPRERAPWEIVTFIGAEAARGLGHAHAVRDPDTGEPLGIVHRDVSPGNIMVGYDGTVKVLDFGVARLNETQGVHTQTGTLRGKFAYMSPEQTLGQDLDARSDVFSLGAVLYEVLTGVNCFRANNPVATLEKVQSFRPQAPSRLHRGLPREVDKVLARCLAKDRRRRFPNAVEVAEALEEILEREGTNGAALVLGFMRERFSWEQHEEASELEREEEEARAMVHVVEFGTAGAIPQDAVRLIERGDRETAQTAIHKVPRALLEESSEQDVFQRDRRTHSNFEASTPGDTGTVPAISFRPRATVWLMWWVVLVLSAGAIGLLLWQRPA